MRIRSTCIGVFVLAMLLLTPAITSSARDEAFLVIVHPKNPVTSIERAFLRAAYLKEGVQWADGSVVQPIALDDRIPAQAAFNEDVVNKTLSQLRNYWVQRIFSGKGVPPIQARTPAEAVLRVLADPRAVAYLPADADAGRAKVVGLR